MKSADMSQGSVLPEKPLFGQVPMQRLTVPDQSAIVPDTRWQTDLSRNSHTLSPTHQLPPRSSPHVSTVNTNTFETSPLTKIPFIESKPPKIDHVDEKLRAVNELLGKSRNMDEFIGKIVEAGKCLQLLNYRVSIDGYLSFQTFKVH